jgi:hypothetical protein
MNKIVKPGDKIVTFQGISYLKRSIENHDFDQAL